MTTGRRQTLSSPQTLSALALIVSLLTLIVAAAAFLRSEHRAAQEDEVRIDVRAYEGLPRGPDVKFREDAEGEERHLFSKLREAVPAFFPMIHTEVCNRGRQPVSIVKIYHTVAPQVYLYAPFIGPISPQNLPYTLDPNHCEWFSMRPDWGYHSLAPSHVYVQTADGHTEWTESSRLTRGDARPVLHKGIIIGHFVFNGEKYQFQGIQHWTGEEWKMGLPCYDIEERMILVGRMPCRADAST